MKRFNKIALFALAGMAFAACTDTYDWTPGGNDSVTAGGDSVQDVSFEQATLSLEKDPTDETTASVRMKRSQTATTDTVPVEILTNTDSVFVVGDLIFQAGDSLADLKIDFPTAEVGKAYTLELAVTDNRYTSAYANNNTFSLKVTRVKWITLEGKGRIVEDFLFGTENPEVEIQMRDDDHTQFRIWHAFHGLLVEAAGGTLYPFEMFNIFSDEASEYLQFRILKNGEEFRGNTIASDNLVYFNPFNSGYHHSSYDDDMMYYHPSTFTKYATQDTWQKNAVLAWQENGLPGKIQLAPYVYLEKVGGGWDVTQEDNQVVIFFPGYKDPVTAKMAEDFNYEQAVFTGDFTSEKLGTSKSVTLYTDTCTLKTDGADKVFEETYGTAYCMDSPYADGFDIYFAVDKDNNVQIPEDVAMQPTGLMAMGDTVFAVINGNKSSFSKNLITLNVSFTTRDGADLGTTNEVLSNITYTTVGTADWAYIFLGNEDGSPYLDEGLELQQRDDKPGTYQILHALNDVTIQFTINEDNTVTFPQQAIGLDYQPGVPLYVTDIYSLNDSYDPCVYDPETTTINALLFYNIGGGQGFTPMTETIKLNFNEQPTESAKAKSPKKAAAKKVTTVVKNVRSPWAGYSKSNTKSNAKPAMGKFGTRNFVKMPLN